MTIGIIGGCGKMGRFFETFFKNFGYEVFISDISCGISIEELLSRCKIILISVPMEVFEDVVKQISPLIKKEHWVLDICSLKKQPVEAMQKFLNCEEILGTHPLFGPYEKDLTNKTIVLCKIKGNSIFSWAKNIFSKAGLKIIEIDPEEHDKIMGVVQTLNHFLLIVLAHTIKEFDLKKLVELATPSFLQQLHILKRFAWQDENLYARIQFDNPIAEEIRDTFCTLCQNINTEFKTKNKEEIFKKYFLEAKKIAKTLEKLLSS